jgi:hypothetical protein
MFVTVLEKVFVVLSSGQEKITHKVTPGLGI